MKYILEKRKKESHDEWRRAGGGSVFLTHKNARDYIDMVAAGNLEFEYRIVEV